MKIGKALGTEVVNTYEGNDWPLPYSMIGVEVEAEHIMSRPQLLNTSFWDIKNDGSLRDGGREFVFKYPMFGKDAENALRNLEQSLDDLRRQYVGRQAEVPKYSHRTSVHVHVDIRDMSPIQLFSMIQNYVIFEKILFNFIERETGVDRTESPFTVPYWECPINYLASWQDIFDLQERDNEQEYIQEVNRVLEHISMGAGFKYSACNFNTVFNIGTIEFRQMAGTHNFELLDKWVRILLYLKKFSMEHTADPEQILMNVSAGGPDNYVRECFRELADDLYFPDIDREVYRGVRRAQDMVYIRSLMDAHKRVYRDSARNGDPGEFTSGLQKCLLRNGRR